MQLLHPKVPLCILGCDRSSQGGLAQEEDREGFLEEMVFSMEADVRRPKHRLIVSVLQICYAPALGGCCPLPACGATLDRVCRCLAAAVLPRQWCHQGWGQMCRAADPEMGQGEACAGLEALSGLCRRQSGRRWA